MMQDTTNLDSNDKLKMMGMLKNSGGNGGPAYVQK